MIITRKKIEVYKKYNCDIDMWARSKSSFKKSDMSDEDWYAIDGLLQDIIFVSKGLASKEFEEKMEEKLIQKCEDEDVIKILKEMI